MTARLLLALVVIASIAGAGFADRAKQEAAIKKLEQFTDAYCKCKAGDTVCAQKVTDEMTKWATEVAKNHDNEKPDPATVKKMEAIVQRMTKCMTAAMTPKSGTPAPDPSAVPKPSAELRAYAKNVGGTWKCTGKRLDPAQGMVDAKLTIMNKLSRDLDDGWVTSTQTMPMGKSTMKSVVLTTHDASTGTWTRVGASNVLVAHAMTSKAVSDVMVWEGDIMQGGATHRMRVTEDLTNPKELSMVGEVEIAASWSKVYEITCKR